MLISALTRGMIRISDSALTARVSCRSFSRSSCDLTILDSTNPCSGDGGHGRANGGGLNPIVVGVGLLTGKIALMSTAPTEAPNEIPWMTLIPLAFWVLGIYETVFFRGFPQLEQFA